MEYVEHPVPRPLHGFVSALWTLECHGTADERLTHEATPDGCVELIRRTRGESSWGRDQPPVFVTGLSEAPVSLAFSGDARFIGLRLWPWAWNLLGDPASPALADDWHDAADLGWLVEAPSADAALDAFAVHALHPFAEAALSAASVGEIARRTGTSHRQVQRWFEREVGMPPRRYLRLLRFGRTMGDMQRNSDSLAAQAAAAGYADQAHMARDFRALAGASARRTRARAIGPFV